VSTLEESYLVGLIGEGVLPSLTPPMHEAEGAAQGILYLYRPIDLLALNRPGTEVGDLLQAGRDLGFNAFNITHPCKQLVLKHLDVIDPDAERLGAVNTVVIKDGAFHGYNTDRTGFGRGLSTGLPEAKLDRVVQIGVGGAGSAIADALLSLGVRHLVLIDLDPARAAERARALSALFPDRTIEGRSTADVAAELAAADGLVHATPIGMHQHPGLPIDPDLLEPRHWVADVVYRPVETELIKAARARGCATLDGGHMAVGQAVDAFRLITGLEPDPARMRAHFLDMLERGL
jgi:shikimate dehydrogenase